MWGARRQEGCRACLPCVVLTYSHAERAAHQTGHAAEDDSRVVAAAPVWAGGQLGKQPSSSWQAITCPMPATMSPPAGCPHPHEQAGGGDKAVIGTLQWQGGMLQCGLDQQKHPTKTNARRAGRGATPALCFQHCVHTSTNARSQGARWEWCLQREAGEQHMMMQQRRQTVLGGRSGLPQVLRQLAVAPRSLVRVHVRVTDRPCALEAHWPLAMVMLMQVQVLRWGVGAACMKLTHLHTQASSVKCALHAAMCLQHCTASPAACWQGAALPPGGRQSVGCAWAALPAAAPPLPP